MTSMVPTERGTVRELVDEIGRRSDSHGLPYPYSLRQNGPGSTLFMLDFNSAAEAASWVEHFGEKLHVYVHENLRALVVNVYDRATVPGWTLIIGGQDPLTAMTIPVSDAIRAEADRVLADVIDAEVVDDVPALTAARAAAEPEPTEEHTEEHVAAYLGSRWLALDVAQRYRLTDLCRISGWHGDWQAAYRQVVGTLVPDHEVQAQTAAMVPADVEQAASVTA